MEGVTVITCTMRPDKIDNIFDNYKKQDYQPKELIIVLNRNSMNLYRFIQIAQNYENVTVYKQPQRKTLGACLNFAIAKAKYPILAKFDDDDYYSPKYLTQAMQVFRTLDASVVGKMSVSTYFEAKEIIAIRKPNHENTYLNNVGFNAPHLGGGTLVWKKSLSDYVRFPNRNVGEDVLFQMMCHQNGFKIYSTDKNHYVSVRRKNKQTHTWNAEDDVVLKESEFVAYTNDYKPFVGGEGI
ncbi:glycosyltransferase [Alkalihalobacillus macyae]|uniref:glycosyltransferase n=1 Tax=Guptibacillus hwajinpoensis TaxID=208199 RepID=UPI00273BFC86|nr:glycosyltransferase [Alkalihalobacillus macyae]MDP4552068.1 glycosyltransferase [Alkalihalobacillus macyae]